MKNKFAVAIEQMPNTSSWICIVARDIQIVGTKINCIDAVDALRAATEIVINYQSSQGEQADEGA